MLEENTDASKNTVQQPVFEIQRIYTKDVSFEAPNSPKIFQKEWSPDVNLDLNASSTVLEDNVYDVVLSLTVTVNVASESIEPETVFLCEVHQAGIFTVSGMDANQLEHCLGAYCPTILFPYARECISNLVSRGTFPQLNLAPVNFDALFMDHLQRKKEPSASASQSIQ